MTTVLAMQGSNPFLILLAFKGQSFMNEYQYFLYLNTLAMDYGRTEIRTLPFLLSHATDARERMYRYGYNRLLAMNNDQTYAWLTLPIHSYYYHNHQQQ